MNLQPVVSTIVGRCSKCAGDVPSDEPHTTELNGAGLWHYRCGPVLMMNPPPSEGSGRG